jgi:hypothetical protein
MRTQEAFPNFGEVDDAATSRRYRRASQLARTNGSICTAASAVEGRVQRLPDGSIRAPATDEAFMREHMREWKRLMGTTPAIEVAR